MSDFGIDTGDNTYFDSNSFVYENALYFFLRNEDLFNISKDKNYYVEKAALVPQDHVVRKLVSFIDWNFIYPLIEHLYSDFGIPSIDPVLFFKMIFISFIFGI